MAEPKQETVRVALPQSPETTHGPQNDDAEHDAARLVPPSHSPATPPRRSPPTITPTLPVNTGIPIISSHRPPVLPPKVTDSPVLHPLPKPAGAPPAPSKAETNLLPRADAPAASESFAGVSVQPGPKKDTARITSLPQPFPVPGPAVKTKKPQPLITRPAAAVMQPGPVIAATSDAIDAFDSIPRWFCWGLLGISALIFLIQIWNYALS